jgi:hypothetical protein
VPAGGTHEQNAANRASMPLVLGQAAAFSGFGIILPEPSAALLTRSACDAEACVHRGSC